LSGPASFVRLAVHGGHETLVDPDIAQLLRGQPLCLSHAYAIFRRGGRVVYLHHCVAGRPLAGDVDHINGDPLDNRRCNLRVVSHSLNVLNQHKSRAPESGFRGVRAMGRGGTWQPSVYWHRRFWCDGSFREPLLAALARDDLVRRVTGFEAGLNFPCWLARSAAEGLLSTGRDPVVVWFVKRSDGSVRRISCRAEPDVPIARRQRDDALGLVTVRDVDVDAARCIPVEAILCLTWNNQSFRVTDDARAAA